MALNLAELTGEKLTVSRSGSNYSIPFLVWRGVPADPLPTKVDVYNRVRGYLKAGGFFTYLGMVLDQIDIDEQGGGVWKVNVSYKAAGGAANHRRLGGPRQATVGPERAPGRRGAGRRHLDHARRDDDAHHAITGKRGNRS